MEVAATSHIIHESPENGTKGKAEKKSGKRIGYNYIILKSLKESRKNDVVKCLYIKSLTNWGICVIKEGTYGDSKDRDGRDIKDKLVWQKKLHLELQQKVRIPKLLGSFEENGNYYLVLERIKGESLYKIVTEKNRELREGLLEGTKYGIRCLGFLVQVTELLDSLHKNGVVHRDVSAANFMIMPNGKVAIIDMELSYSLEQQLPSPPFQLGTYGYMSPEQETMQPPAITQDVYSVGAILLQAWTGISPSKLTNDPMEELAPKIRFFVPDKIIADTIIQLLQPDSARRPRLNEVQLALVNYKTDLLQKRKRAVYPTLWVQRGEILDSIQQSIYTLASPLLADAERGWFSEDMSADKNINKRKIDKAWYASFNKGAAGVIYMLSLAHRLEFDTAPAAVPVQQGLDLVKEKYINRIEQISPSLHFGSSGIAASLCVAIKQGLIEVQSEHIEWIDRLLPVSNTKFSIMDGMAGQGIAYWHAERFLPNNRVTSRLQQYAKAILDAQQKDGSWINEVVKGRARVTRGFAHGVAGIVYFLLEYAHRYNNSEVMQAAKKGLQWLIKKSVQENEQVNWRSTKGKEIGPWWCEGAPGIALSFLKAYAITGEATYKSIAERALKVHDKNMVNNNLSQCHGLSGLGEIYLDAYAVLQEEEWLDRAGWIAQVLMKLKKVHPQHGPYWIAEHERQPVSNFMTGHSGVVHFLMRYCHPGKMGFPLLGIY